MKVALRKFLKYFVKTAIFFLVVLLLFLGSLFFREQKLPRFAIDRLVDEFSNEQIEFTCDGAFFGFRHGIRISGIQIFDKTNADFRKKPIASIRNAHYDFFRRQLWLYALKYDRLPESYYQTESTFSTPSPIDFEVPDLEGFSFILEFPEILGLTPHRVFGNISASKTSKKITVDNIEILLSGQDSDTVLRGFATMDLKTQKIKSHLRGDATQRQIRPFLEVLDIQCSLPYIDAFTDIVVPVEAEADFDISLYPGDIAILLDLTVPKMGKYNSVPMSYAKGSIDFHSKVDEDNRRVAVKVTLPSAVDNQGRRLDGWIAIDDFSDRYKIHYDVKTSLKFEDALKIADFIDPSLLDFVIFDDSPTISVYGVSGTSAEDLALNNIKGEFNAQSGVVDGFKFANVKGDYSFNGDIFNIKAEMTGVKGGKAKVNSTVYCERFEEDRAHFSLIGSYRDGSLEELAQALSFDLGQRQGAVDIDIDISGPIASNFWTKVNGKGSMKISNGHLARMKLFAGLTELLADRIPGVSFLVDQTQASADFCFTNGVFKTNNLYIEGGLVSIKGWGSYDIAEDNLDFTSRVQFMKKESVAGKIIHPLTYPFTKMLLEFKVTGSIDNPKWEYIQITDRIF